jgi:hypothetical protein
MVLSINLAARGDVPRPPKPAPADDSSKPAKADPQLQITLEKDGKTAHLRLPRSVVQALSASGHPARADSGISPARTAVAGIALASALAVGGLFLARGRLGRGRNLMVIAMAGGVGLLTTFSLADLPPFNPNAPRWHRLVPPAPAENAVMPVVIDTVDEGPIQLTLPADQAAKIAQLPTTRPAESTGR